MKVFIVLSALVVAVSAGGYGTPGYDGASSGGVSSQYRSDDTYGNYKFGYDESHSSGSSSRHEEESNGVRRGSYSLTDVDGRRRTVRYIADHTGFHATVDTNEPGTEAKSPADVIMNGAAPALSNSFATYHGAAPAMRGYQQAAPRARYAAPAGPNTYAAPAGPNTYAAPAGLITYAAPARLNAYAAPANLNTYSAPARVAHPLRASYGGSSYSAPTGAYLAAPMRSYSAPVAARSYSPLTPISTYSAPTGGYSAQIEAPTPRAFRYSFSAKHPTASFGQAAYNDGASHLAPAPVQSYGGFNQARTMAYKTLPNYRLDSMCNVFTPQCWQSSKLNTIKRLEY